MAESLRNKIISATQTVDDITFLKGLIVLQDDNDGLGAYIKEWNVDEELPSQFSIGKRQQ